MFIPAGNWSISNWQHFRWWSYWKIGNKFIVLSLEILNFLWHINTFQTLSDTLSPCLKNTSLNTPMKRILRKMFPGAWYVLDVGVISDAPDEQFYKYSSSSEIRFQSACIHLCGSDCKIKCTLSIVFSSQLICSSLLHWKEKEQITGAPNDLFQEKSIPGAFLAGWQILGIE